MAVPATKLLHKELLFDWGFLVYMTRTYAAMVPNLKGFYLTIKIWHGGWDTDGWKLKEGDDPLSTDMDKAATDHCLGIKAGSEYLYAPCDGFTTPVPRLKDNVNALQLLTNFALVLLCVVRPAHMVHVYYGFSNASGKQFGATLLLSYNCWNKLSKPSQVARGICFRVGLWSVEEEEEISNYKDLRNLVDTVLEEVRVGRMRDTQPQKVVFIGGAPNCTTFIPWCFPCALLR